MRLGTYIEIEVETADGTSIGEPFITKNASDALSFVRTSLQPGIAIILACIGNGVDYGNLVVEAVSPGICNLRALEHRGFAISDVSVEQALDAVQYWLPQQERTPTLAWHDE